MVERQEDTKVIHRTAQPFLTGNIAIRCFSIGENDERSFFACGDHEVKRVKFRAEDFALFGFARLSGARTCCTQLRCDERNLISHLLHVVA